MYFNEIVTHFNNSTKRIESKRSRKKFVCVTHALEGELRILVYLNSSRPQSKSYILLVYIIRGRPRVQ